MTVLCIATYEKGHAFIEEMHAQGHRVLLLTADTLRGADWPRHALTELFYVPRTIARDDLVKGVSHVARTYSIDRIVALDDFDVETAAALREHLRVPGMGETTARYFRDKLAMRMRARYAGILVPEFVHVLNDEQIAAFAARVAPPWFLKPRSSAAAIGISRIERIEDLWPAIEALGDRRSFFLLEQYVPGDVFHVDAIVWDTRVVFDAAHRYGRPPFDIAHHGGVFTTRTLEADTEARQVLAAIDREVLGAFGMVRGVTHTEFIRAHDDGRWHFLETSARVGGAFIADLVEAATGVNLWREWARVEIAGEDWSYEPPPATSRYAGLVLSLAREAEPDLSGYRDPEIVTRIRKHHHAGLIAATEDSARLDALLDEYAGRFARDLTAWQPAPESPTA